MINLKWSAVAAGFGFVISLLVGIISGAGFPWVLIRALILAAVFFILAALIWILVNNFIPELLYDRSGDGGSGESPGSRVDISVGDSQESALPGVFGHSGDEIGDISDLFAAGAVNGPGMDHTGEDGYTNTSGTEFQAEPRGPSPAGDGSGGEEGLPDLDAMAAAFQPAGEDPAEDGAAVPAPERSPIGNKPQNLHGDFQPKELAAAIRTTLLKE